MSELNARSHPLNLAGDGEDAVRQAPRDMPRVSVNADFGRAPESDHPLKRKVPHHVLNEVALRRTKLHSEELGIELAANTDRELFKWFLASVLLGARISETLAKRTYRTFERHRLLTPQRILNAGWDYLVDPIMREGGYVRYDGKTSNEILRNCEMLIAEYGGSLKRLHALARNSHDLEARLDRFYGVGPITVNIFLRELRPHWSKADPAPLPRVKALARRLQIDLRHYPRRSMAFTRIEAGLIRHRKMIRPHDSRRAVMQARR